MAKHGGGVMERGEVSNDGKAVIDASAPYIARVVITGSADLLFHRWKKSDNLESYIARDDAGFICLPGDYLRQSIIHSAKYRQDPRSPRKSAMDLFKAGVVNLTPLARIGPTHTKTWQYEHACRVTVQRNGITRVRPAFKIGWTAEIYLARCAP